MNCTTVYVVLLFALFHGDVATGIIIGLESSLYNREFAKREVLCLILLSTDYGCLRPIINGSKTSAWHI